MTVQQTAAGTTTAVAGRGGGSNGGGGGALGEGWLAALLGLGLARRRGRRV